MADQSLFETTGVFCSGHRACWETPTNISSFLGPGMRRNGVNCMSRDRSLCYAGLPLAWHRQT
eukprot:1225225-Alexandrium_andersonii.AAC.1